MGGFDPVFQPIPAVEPLTCDNEAISVSSSPLSSPPTSGDEQSEEGRDEQSEEATSLGFGDFDKSYNVGQQV